MRKDERERLMRVNYDPSPAVYWEARYRLLQDRSRVLGFAVDMLAHPGGDIGKFRFIERLLLEVGVENIDTSNCDWRMDEDDCFELCFMSGVDAHDLKPGDKDYDGPSKLEAREIAEAVDKAGGEVVSMSDPEFWGYPEYTPDPGNVRLVKVRLK